MHSIGPKGERHGWLRIKNCQEQFLTMHSIGPKGEAGNSIANSLAMPG